MSIMKIQALFNNLPLSNVRMISSSLPRFLKEIRVQQEKDTLVVSADYVESSRKPLLLDEVTKAKKFCPKCTLGLDLKHTDVLILSQYVRSDGCMLPQRVTGLCKIQQKKIGTLVTMAQKAGLMPNLAPANSKRDPKKRFEWKKYNKYFDETTIKISNRRID